MEAFVYEPDGSGCGRLSEIPVRLREEATAAHQALVELVAEGKDELMEEYFREGTIPEEHLIVALHEAIREDRIFPVLFASGLRNVGSDHLLDFLQVYAPAPVERVPGSCQGRRGHAPCAAERRTVIGARQPTRLRLPKWCCARWMIASRCRCMSSRPCPIPLREGSLFSRSFPESRKATPRSPITPTEAQSAWPT